MYFSPRHLPRILDFKKLLRLTLCIHTPCFTRTPFPPVIQQIPRQLRNLRIIDWHYSHVRSSSSMSNVLIHEYLPELESLHLDVAFAFCAPDLSGLTKLTELSLGFTGTCPAWYEGCKVPSTVHTMSVVGALPPTLKDMTCLKHVTVSHLSVRNGKSVVMALCNTVMHTPSLQSLRLSSVKLGVNIADLPTHNNQLTKIKEFLKGRLGSVEIEVD
jgi:hypothetical protein